MSFSSVSLGASSHATSTDYKSVRQQRSTDFSALSQALSSNDLSGAQAAFAKLQSDPRATSSGQGDTPSPQRIADLKKLKADSVALGAALNAGKLGAAKTAFTTLNEDMVKAHMDRVAARHGTPSAPSASGTSSAGSNLRAPLAASAVGGSVDLTA